MNLQHCLIDNIVSLLMLVDRMKSPCLGRVWSDMTMTVQERLFLLEDLAVENKSSSLFDVL